MCQMCGHVEIDNNTIDRNKELVILKRPWAIAKPPIGLPTSRIDEPIAYLDSALARIHIINMLLKVSLYDEDPRISGWVLKDFAISIIDSPGSLSTLSLYKSKPSPPQSDMESHGVRQTTF